jgi:hypothetical protein
MAEAQAVDRVHRIGQSREVVVTRYLVANSIEDVRNLLSCTAPVLLTQIVCPLGSRRQNEIDQ